ncbi:hypothetical protein J6590_047646 [Homalodisca vitripennis]|nr:hypothetical protein J6590_047646 [Homalodisca vitripennis]
MILYPLQSIGSSVRPAAHSTRDPPPHYCVRGSYGEAQSLITALESLRALDSFSRSTCGHHTMGLSPLGDNYNVNK